MRDASGEPKAFRFDSDPAEQPQAYVFYSLTPTVDHPTPSRADGTLTKHVTVAGSGAPQVVQVGYPLDKGSPVSPHFGS